MPGTTETVLSERAGDPAADADAPSPLDESSAEVLAAEAAAGPPDVGGAEAGFVDPGAVEPAPAPADGCRAAVAGAAELAAVGNVPACALDVGNVESELDREK